MWAGVLTTSVSAATSMPSVTVAERWSLANVQNVLVTLVVGATDWLVQVNTLALMALTGSQTFFSHFEFSVSSMMFNLTLIDGLPITDTSFTSSPICCKLH